MTEMRIVGWKKVRFIIQVDRKGRGPVRSGVTLSTSERRIAQSRTLSSWMFGIGFRCNNQPKVSSGTLVGCFPILSLLQIPCATLAWAVLDRRRPLYAR